MHVSLNGDNLAPDASVVRIQVSPSAGLEGSVATVRDRTLRSVMTSSARSPSFNVTCFCAWLGKR